MLKTGIAIICPNCKKELFEVTQDIHEGCFIKEERLKKIEQQPKDGDPMQCNFCGTKWYNPDTGTVFTTSGWIS